MSKWLFSALWYIASCNDFTCDLVKWGVVLDEDEQFGAAPRTKTKKQCFPSKKEHRNVYLLQVFLLMRVPLCWLVSKVVLTISAKRLFDHVLLLQILHYNILSEPMLSNRENLSFALRRMGEHRELAATKLLLNCRYHKQPKIWRYVAEYFINAD